MMTCEGRPDSNVGEIAMVCEVRRKLYELEERHGEQARPLYKILPELLSLKEKTPIELLRIRRSLNGLAQSYVGKPQYAMVCFVINILKNVNASHINDDWDKKYRHAVSDHALCMYLQRYAGIDILSLKDHVLKKIDGDIKDFIFKEGVIVTLLPKGGISAKS